MAKPRFPKKTTDVKEAVSTNTTAPTAETKIATPEATAATPLAAETTKKTQPKTNGTRKSARMPENGKADSRSNLVPINLDDEIRELAYLFSERRGFEPGHESEDWLAAEHEVRQRYHQLSAAASA